MKKNDLILIGAVLLLAVLVFGWSSSKKQEAGGTAVVYVDTEEIGSYSLEEDGEYVIETEQGENVLVIKDGTADITEADCPDKLCVKQRKISKNGETLVCLPHKVVVEIKSSQESELDGVTN